MKYRVLSVFLLSVFAFSGCLKTDPGSKVADGGPVVPPTGPVNSAPPSGGPKQVAGFDFTGFKILDSLPTNFTCPLTQVVSPETEACRNARGVITQAQDCVILCNQPIADDGMVAGYDFMGPRSAPALPANKACAQVANAETDACLKINGSPTGDESCKPLCNRPIARTGKYAGFDFTGFKILDSLPTNFTCPLTQVVSPEKDACRQTSGIIGLAKDCVILCDHPITDWNR